MENRKYWIEVHHPGQIKPSLQTITDLPQAEIKKMVESYDALGLPWAFGCGERMPDALPDEGRDKP